jgi:hypothetical protein
MEKSQIQSKKRNVASQWIDIGPYLALLWAI